MIMSAALAMEEENKKGMWIIARKRKGEGKGVEVEEEEGEDEGEGEEEGKEGKGEGVGCFVGWGVAPVGIIEGRFDASVKKQKS